jgi:hypothetical protein
VWIGTWLGEHWFSLAQTLGIVASFAIASRSLALDSRSRRAELHFMMTASHREIWEHYVNNPSLASTLDPSRKISGHPPKPAEERFVLLVLLHSATVFHAVELHALRQWPGWKADVKAFFSLPVPRAVAERFLEFQEPGFRRFLSDLLDLHGGS